MNSDKKTAIIVGVLFIACTVTSILSGLFIGPLDAPDYLVNVAANENQVLKGMLVQSIWALTCVGIPVMLFPILKKHNEALALGFFSLRLIEGVFVFLAIVCQLSILTLSKEFVTGVLDASYYQASGTLLLAARDWGGHVVLDVAVFPLGALIFNYLLYQSKLIPRWLSIWGLIGAPLALAEGLLSMFGLFDSFSTNAILLSLPIAVNEMVLAVWLIVKGFNSSAIASGSAKTDINKV